MFPLTLLMVFSLIFTIIIISIIVIILLWGIVKFSNFPKVTELISGKGEREFWQSPEFESLATRLCHFLKMERCWSKDTKF
jgi:hypothetical protein